MEEDQGKKQLKEVAARVSGHAQEWAEKAGRLEAAYNRACHIRNTAIAFAVIAIACMAMTAYLTSEQIKQTQEDAKKGILRENPIRVRYQHHLLMEHCDAHIRDLTKCLRGGR